MRLPALRRGRRALPAPSCLLTQVLSHFKSSSVAMKHIAMSKHDAMLNAVHMTLSATGYIRRADVEYSMTAAQSAETVRAQPVTMSALMRRSRIGRFETSCQLTVSSVGFTTSLSGAIVATVSIMFSSFAVCICAFPSLPSSRRVGPLRFSSSRRFVSLLPVVFSALESPTF